MHNEEVLSTKVEKAMASITLSSICIIFQIIHKLDIIIVLLFIQNTS